VTYSTRSVPPSLTAQLVSLLPARLATWPRKYFGAQISQWNRGEKYDAPHLFIWFRPAGTNAPVVGGVQTFHARLSDQAGIESGVTDYSIFGGGVTWSCAEFSVVPKRSRIIHCNLYPFGGGNYSRAIGAASFLNPAYGRFPQWQSEPLPTVKQAGDLEVRLDDFMTGRQGGGAYHPFRKGQDAATGFGVTFKSLGDTNEVWVIQSAELSDATRNVLVSSFGRTISPFNPHRANQTAVTESLSGTLWPDESAWRLKLELKRAWGYNGSETVTFTNVPVPVMGTTNTTPISKTVGGIQVVLMEFARKPDQPVPSGGILAIVTRIRVELPSKPAGVALNYLDSTTDAGKPEHYGRSEGDYYVEELFKSLPTNAQTVDITFVVQKTRSVEFLVKPPKPE
jgi:hypothetical protein